MTFKQKLSVASDMELDLYYSIFIKMPHCTTDCNHCLFSDETGACSFQMVYGEICKRHEPAD